MLNNIKWDKSSTYPLLFICIALWLYFSITTIDTIIHFQKLFVLINSVLATSVIVFLFILAKNKISIKTNLVDYLMIVYLSYILTSSICQDNFVFNYYLYLKLSLIAWYFISSFFLVKNDSVQMKSFFILSILLAVFSIEGVLQIFGFSTYYLSKLGISGNYSNPAPYAGLLILLIPLVLSYVVYNFNQSITNKLQSIFFYLATFSLIVAVFLILSSNSRAALLAIMAAAVVVINQHFKILDYIEKKVAFFKKIKIPSLILLSIGLLFFLVSIRPSSVIGRLLIWKISLQELFLQKPFFGFGIDYFRRHYSKHQANYFDSGNWLESEMLNVTNTPYAFNEFVKIIVEEGIVGLLLFLAIIVTCGYYLLIHSKKNNQDNDSFNLHTGVLASLVAAVVFSFFSYPLNDPLWGVLFFTLIALSSSFMPRRDIFFLKGIFKYPLIIGLLPLLAYCYHFNYSSNQAFHEWKNSISYYNEDRVETLANVEHYLRSEGGFYIDYAKALNDIQDEKGAVELLIHAKKLTSEPNLYLNLGRIAENLAKNTIAISSYNQLKNTLPFKFVPRQKLMNLYIKEGDIENALLLAHEIINLQEKIPSRTVQMIKKEALELIAEFE